VRSALLRVWLPATAVTVALLAGLGFLYVKAQGASGSDYVENVALLRQLKQLDAHWELEVLKSRIGINPHYDPLAASFTALTKPLEKLGADLRTQNHDKAEDLLESQAALLSVIREKETLVEQFKSTHAVLRNSVAFLPTAAQESRIPPGRVSANVNRLLLATMRYSQSAIGQGAAEIRTGLAELEADLPALAPLPREGLQTFAAHVRTVLHEQQRVNDLLVAIADVPTATRIDEIGNLLSAEQRHVESRSLQYQTSLLAFSALLLALLLGAAVRLLRTHATINRVNRELHDANENLAQRVKEATQELRQITDAVSVMIFYVDDQRRFRFHNKAAEGVLELTSAQIAGRTVREVVGEAVYAQVCPWIDKALAGIPVRYEHSRVTQEGERRDFLIQYLPRRKDDRDDQPVIGYYGLSTDITEMKRIDRMKSEFVSTVSHELRTPLTSIRGSLGLIAGGVAGVLPDTAKGLVDIAKTNCERLIRLVNNILDTEKIESGKMQLDLNVVEIQSLIGLSIAANEGFALQHGVSIHLLEGGEAVNVNVDSDGLCQVLTNLLSNAVKFSPHGSSVDVSVTRGRTRVRVEVHDHGPGIPEEFRSRIFQKFSQADSSDSRQKGGTGLGLNISKAIIERLGGTIGFRTGSGDGTTFFFELPKWQDKPAEVTGAEAHGAKRPRVLVCEDEPDISRLIGMMLDGAGYDTDFAYTAAQAIDLASVVPYAAMTLDLKLPDQSGIELMRTLRDEEHTRRLPIIVVSANIEEGRSQLAGERLEVSAWLSKPIDVGRLVAAMRAAIAQAAGADTRRAGEGAVPLPLFLSAKAASLVTPVNSH
jgi:PAS domain S-box-containing protein